MSTTHIRRGSEQQEVLMLTPSCVAAVDALTNGQALSTQAQRSVLTHFAICPLLDLLLLHQLHCARWPSSLPGQVLPSSNANALSYKDTQTSFYDGAIFAHLCLLIHDPIRHGGKPLISTR